jgi:regulator of RNase E activity RraA
VSVRPGDVVIADETGIVVMDPADAEAAADRAIQMQHDEIDKRRRLDAGEKLPDISGAGKVLADALAKQTPTRK